MFDTNVALVEHVLNESSAPAPYQSLTPVALNNLDSSAGPLRRRVFISQALSWIARSIAAHAGQLLLRGARRIIMKSYVLTTLIIVSLFVPTAQASDDGQTQPRLTKATLTGFNTSTDIIATTNGSGNVKGVHCKFIAEDDASIKIYVNGGSAQTLFLETEDYPDDLSGNVSSGWIPLNVRFTSSIRVQLTRPSGAGGSIVTCMVSWGLD